MNDQARPIEVVDCGTDFNAATNFRWFCELCLSESQRNRVSKKCMLL
jgi:hypothetical protein